MARSVGRPRQPARQSVAIATVVFRVVDRVGTIVTHKNLFDFTLFRMKNRFSERPLEAFWHLLDARAHGRIDTLLRCPIEPVRLSWSWTQM